MTAPAQPVGDNAAAVTAAVEAALASGATAAAVTAAVGGLAGVSKAMLAAIFRKNGFAKYVKDALADAARASKIRDPSERAVWNLAVKDQARIRGAYLVTAVVRLAKAYATKDPETIKAAEAREAKLYKAHAAAVKHREDQTGFVARAVKGQKPDKQGRILLGWHADDNKNQCARCAAADGKNFDALDPPPIGWPGWVHPHCYCKPGPVFPGGGSVDDVDPDLREQRDTSGLQFGRGSKLWRYWTTGKGTARYLGSPHPWTALRDALRDALLKEGVPAGQADGLATNIMLATPAGRAAFKAHHGGKKRSENVSETRSADAGKAILEYRAPSADKPDQPYGFTARAVNYGVADSYNTSWQRGVFAESLEKRLPPVVWGHDRNDPIGRVVGYRDNADGLDIDVELDDFDAVPRAKQAYAQLKSGTMDQFSFAFKRAEHEPDPQIRGCTRITKAGVDEFSVVLVGAVPGTHVTGIRSAPQPVLEFRDVNGGPGEADPMATLSAVDAALGGLAQELDAGDVQAARNFFSDAYSRLADLLYLLGRTPTAPDYSSGMYAADEGETREDAEVLALTREAQEDEVRARFDVLATAGKHGNHRSRLAAHTRASGNGKKPYGDVTYADPGYQKDKKKRYPLDTKAHVQSAWSYINKDSNAAQYSSEQLAKVKGAIKAAAKRFGIETSDAA